MYPHMLCPGVTPCREVESAQKEQIFKTEDSEFQKGWVSFAQISGYHFKQRRKAE